MGKITKRQEKRIKYFLKEKAERRDKQELIHQDGQNKFIDKHLPYIRKIAPNLDQILIVTSFVTPPVKPGLVDRLLVLAEIESLNPIICFNKTDLLDNPDEAKDIVSIYKNIGYDTFASSVKKHENIEEIHELLKGKRTALAGHSGVGKSSLLNAMVPKLKLRVNDVSQASNKGKHTTTKIRIYSLDKKTDVIDLPGLKLVDFVDIHRDEARFYFREFLQYAEQCKFRDCLHLSEIDCAVKNAVNEKLIDARRYESYCHFVNSLG
ncbi:MAG: ribosome small subunit-dependent GTPase A [Calditrichaceae bacterium]